MDCEIPVFVSIAMKNDRAEQRGMSLTQPMRFILS